MSSYNYTYGGYPIYYNRYSSLTNNCLPRTNAITDNSKFNLGTMVKVYVDRGAPNMGNCNCDRNYNCNCNSNCNCKKCGHLRGVEKQDCNLLTNHSDPKDIKAFDKNKEICLNDETKVEPSGCKTCSVENIM